jgi:lipopolysaccharide export system permease protein
MSIITRYLLNQYLKYFVSCLGIALCMIIFTRLINIVKVIIYGAAAPLVMKIFVTFLPLFLSISVPVASLISACITSHSLSSSGELTAARTNGFSSWQLISPILFFAVLQSLFLMYFNSQWETKAHITRRGLYKEVYLSNPLRMFLHGQMFMHGGGQAVFQPTDNQYSSLTAALVAPTGRSLLYFSSPSKRVYDNASTPSSMITTYMGETGAPFLVIENTHCSEFNFGELNDLFVSKQKMKLDYLPLGQFRLYQKHLKKSFDDSSDFDKKKFIKKRLNCCVSELFRRVSLGLMSLTLTLLALSQGLYQSRIFPIKNFIYIGLGTMTCLTSFFVAHGIEEHLWIAIPLYLLPQLFIILFSLISINTFNHSK